jgi:hypothetical protein
MSSPSLTPMSRSWRWPPLISRYSRARAMANADWALALSLCHLYVLANEMAQMVDCARFEHKVWYREC